MILVHFQGKPLNITTIKVHVKTTNAEEPEGDQTYEDLQDHLRLELTSKKLKQTNKPLHHRGLECKIRRSRDI